MYFVQIQVFPVTVNEIGYECHGEYSRKNPVTGSNVFHVVNLRLNERKDLLPMKKQLDHVEKFHDTFGIANQYAPTTAISEKTIDLRFRLMAEENEEYLEAAKAGDMVEVADALGDMMYILCGTILSHGMQHVIEEVFEEIQSSNMSKLGEDGKPIYREDGKVMKGPGYFKPNIAAVLERHKG